MSTMARRDFLTRAMAFSAAAATLGGAGRAVGDPSLTNNVTDPLLAGKELPTFKFALEKSKWASGALRLGGPGEMGGEIDSLE